MNKAAYWQRGETINYTNDTTTTIEAGTIIPFGTRLGVAGTDIAPGELGSLHMTGVFEMPKDGSDLSAGDELYYDVENQCITSTVKDIVAGYAVAAAVSSDEVVVVKILG